MPQTDLRLAAVIVLLAPVADAVLQSPLAILLLSSFWYFLSRPFLYRRRFTPPPSHGHCWDRALFSRLFFAVEGPSFFPLSPSCACLEMFLPVIQFLSPSVALLPLSLIKKEGDGEQCGKRLANPDAIVVLLIVIPLFPLTLTLLTVCCSTRSPLASAPALFSRALISSSRPLAALRAHIFP